METSYLKAHPFGNRYPEWMPSLPLVRWPGFTPMRFGINLLLVLLPPPPPRLHLILFRWLLALDNFNILT